MEFSTNVLLNETANNRFQLLYTSQNYNTFYGIFGRFKVEKNIVKSVDFKLINFKGIIDLGIKKVNFNGFQDELIENFFDTTQKFSEINCAVFEIEVQALNPDTFIQDIPINRPLGDFKDKFLSIRRNLVKINKSSKGVFDSEFEYRDGLRDSYKYSKNFLNYKKGTRILETNPNDSNSQIEKGPGGICPRGHAKVLF